MFSLKNTYIDENSAKQFCPQLMLMQNYSILMENLNLFTEAIIVVIVKERASGKCRVYFYVATSAVCPKRHCKSLISTAFCSADAGC